MSWKRAAAIASAVALAGATLLGAGCGGPAKPSSGLKPPQLSRRLEAIDLLPADLDIVIRIDVARLKAGLGPAFAEALAARATETGSEPFVAEAMAKADAVWIGLRLADLDAGDRVLVAEGRLDEIHLTPSEWLETTPAATLEGVRILDRPGPSPRPSTSRIIVQKDKLYAFVSPVEVDATSRLLRDGPDPGRGDPTADGLLSADIRGHRLPRSLEKKYPSIGAVIAGITRLRASASLKDTGLSLTLEITTKHDAAAQRVERFLTTIRDASATTKYAELMKSVVLERVNTTLHIKAVVPAAMVIGALSGTAEAP